MIGLCHSCDRFVSFWSLVCVILVVGLCHTGDWSLSYWALLWKGQHIREKCIESFGVRFESKNMKSKCICSN